MDQYDLIANNLAQGNGYRVEAYMSETMIREPGYPLFLAMVFKIAGYHIEAARLANLLLVLGIAPMMMRLTQRITADGVTAVIAIPLFLFYPGTLISEARGGIEIVFVFAVVLFLLVLHHAAEKRDLWRYFLAGLLLGLAVLVRSVVLAFPLFLLVYLLLTANSARERLKQVLRIAVLVLGTVVVMLPWIVRNYMLVQKLVPTATVAGISAHEGQCTCQHFSLDRDFYALETEAGRERNELANRLGIPHKNTYYPTFYDPRDEVVYNKSLLKSVATEYRKDPALLVRCAARNLFFNFWFLGRTWQATWLNVLVQVPFLLLALGGVYLLWKRRLLRRMGIILTFLVYMPAVHALIIAHARHSMVVVPFLAMFASVALVSLWRAQMPGGRGQVLRFLPSGISR
jgi:4-amino-4-deoxy-L-arabinose transferase-like glycosyltransferase